jgi:FkbM family methyltransferase
MPPLPRFLGTLAFLMAWLVPWRPAFGVRAGRLNLTFSVHHRDAIGRHIAKYGTHEPLLTQWLSDYLDAAGPGLFVDIGANCGWHALHAAQHSNVEHVLAFEPDPFNAWLLDRNIARNDIENVLVEVSAVGARQGTARLSRHKRSNLGRHSIVTDERAGSRMVPLTELDGALDRIGIGEHRIAAIKVDVEGHEPAVIAGAARALARTNALILEYSPDLSRAGGLSTDDMITRLDRAGFVPFVLRSAGGTSRITLHDLRGLQGSVDVIWLKSERLTPAIEAAMNQRERGVTTLNEIAEQNKRVLKSI